MNRNKKTLFTKISHYQESSNFETVSKTRIGQALGGYISIRSLELRPELKKRMRDIELLEDNWDGFQALAPEAHICKVVRQMISHLPIDLSESLDPEDLYPNPHGTITAEWVKGDDYAAIEYGNKGANFLVRVNGQYILEGETEDFKLGFNNQLIYAIRTHLI